MKSENKQLRWHIPREKTQLKNSYFIKKRPEKFLVATNEALEIYNQSHKTHYWYCIFCWGKIKNEMKMCGAHKDSQTPCNNSATPPPTPDPRPTGWKPLVQKCDFDRFGNWEDCLLQQFDLMFVGPCIIVITRCYIIVMSSWWWA